AADEGQLGRHLGGGGGLGGGVEAAAAEIGGAQAGDAGLRRAAGNVRGHVRGAQDAIAAEVVGVGVAGAFARKHAHADAQGNALGGTLDQSLFERNGRGGLVLEVQVGVVAAAGKRSGEVVLEVGRRDAIAGGEEFLGGAERRHGSISILAKGLGRVALLSSPPWLPSPRPRR